MIYDCEYKCKPNNNISNENINKDSYSEKFIIMNLDKIMQNKKFI